MDSVSDPDLKPTTVPSDVTQSKQLSTPHGAFFKKKRFLFLFINEERFPRIQFRSDGTDIADKFFDDGLGQKLHRFLEQTIDI